MSAVQKLLKKEIGAVTISATRVRVPPQPGLINLGAGDPDFNQPKYIADTVYKAILEGYTHYSFGGEPELMEALANYYAKWGYKADPSTQVVITSGGSQGIFHALAALVNPGEEVILFDPTYGGYSGPAGYLGAKIVRSPLKKDSKGYFRPDIEALKTKITDKTKALVICNPDNPTGSVFTKAELTAIADLAKDKNFAVIADEIYTEYIWGGRPFYPIIAAPDMADRTIVVGSFSKMFAWTGCRAGFLISGPNLAPYLGRVPLGINSMPVPFQKAATVALIKGSDFTKYMASQYLERIEYCADRLNEMKNVSCVMPESTFYVFPDISKTGVKSAEFSAKLGEQEKIRGAAGASYGPTGEGHIRLALVEPLNVLVEAMDRFERFVNKL